MENRRHKEILMHDGGVQRIVTSANELSRMDNRMIWRTAPRLLDLIVLLRARKFRNTDERQSLHRYEKTATGIGREMYYKQKCLQRIRATS